MKGKILVRYKKYLISNKIIMKIGLVFGGMSSENQVSVISAKSIYNNIDKTKYEIQPIYIDKKGEWWKINFEIEENIEINDKKEKIENIIKFIKEMDLIFPVLHGLYGEDGTIQGMFEMAKIPYVGCGVLSSSVGMDKVYTKIIFEKAGLKQARYKYIREFENQYIYIDENFNETRLPLDEIAKKITKDLTFPMFIKPSNSGSSVGISKVNNINELKEKIKYATNFDRKVLIEQSIKGREVECAVLGNEDVISSCIGEVHSAEDFYSYDAKYNNKESKTDIPANIDEDISNEIRNQAIKAFKAIDGKGLSRVDFFIEDNSKDIYINEINTLPGFTTISMYPKLFEASGISYKELLDKIINLALN